MRSQGLRIAIAVLLNSTSLLASGAFAQTSSDTGTETVVVTAEKREERLQDVPAAVDAVSGGKLETLNINSLADLAGYVPSLTLSNYGAPGTNTMEIRGLGDGYLSDFAGPLVATYIDDLPLGSSTAAGRGNLFNLDLMPYDIDRIEVLEGPQGTLYGANAMGGLIKYALKQPDYSGFNARIGGDVAHVGDSGGVDWGVRAAANVPLIDDVLSVRISGFQKTQAGYIDNIGTNTKDANNSTEEGGRFAVLWNPTERLTLQGNIILQNVDVADLTNVTLNGATFQPLYGTYTTKTFFPQSLKQQTRDYTVRGSFDAGFATLSSSIGWSNLNTTLHEDFSDPYAAFAGNPSAAYALYEVPTKVQKFVEETRLTSSGTDQLQWMVGQYYTREHGTETDSWPTFTSSYQQLPAANNLFITDQRSAYQEVAGFANATYLISNVFDVSAGGRFATYSQTTYAASTGVFGTGTSYLDPPAKSITTWMANARYHIDQDNMFYVRVATGYRPGGPNPPATGVPTTSEPDRTTNYEAGFKGTMLDGDLQYSATGFHIDWKNIQLEELSNLGLAFVANGGKAVSDGAELSASYKLLPGLVAGGALAYTDAHLAQAVPSAGGNKGDQLPLSARWVGSVTLDYTRPLYEDITLLAGIAYKHKDSIVNQFEGTGNPLPLGPQNIVDIYIGSQIRDVTIRLYGKNIFSDHSYTGLQFLNDLSVPRVIPVQPATVGLSVDYKL